MAAREQDVFRLDVAMNQSMLVGILQRVGYLPRDADRVFERELTLPVQPISQRLTLHERHDVEQKLSGRAAGGSAARLTEPES